MSTVSPEFAQGCLLQSIVGRLLDTFCPSSATPNITKIDFAITVEVPSNSRGPSLWLGEAGPGQITSIYQTSNLELVPGALPTLDKLLALLAKQRTKHRDLEIFSIGVRLRIISTYFDEVIQPFWCFFFPDRQSTSLSLPSDLVEHGQLSGGIKEQAKFYVSREGVQVARYIRGETQHLHQESINALEEDEEAEEEEEEVKDFRLM